MRLTLRTLLAYLDDVLPPDQAKEMGQKLSESGYATALVDRIKEVMRRRRLSAPDLSGKAAGIDPNIVAEYLDNELTPAEVADVEKICLDSDVHLAEVAAAHQILTIVLGEPVEVRPELRSRMYALGPVAMSDRMRASEDSSSRPMPTVHSNIPSVAATVATPHVSMLDESISDPLKSTGSWKQTGVLALVVLVGVGWISLLLRDDTVTNGLKSNKSPNDVVSDDGAKRSEKLDPSRNEEPTSATEKSVSVAADDHNELPPVKNVAVTSSPKNELPDLDAGTQVAEAEPLPKKLPRKEKPVVIENAAPPKADAAPAQAEPVTLPATKMMYTSKEGILLHFDKSVNDFVVLPRRAELRPGDRLASPDPFRADIMIGDDVGLVALNGGTAVRCLPPTDRTPLGFHLQQGSLLFEVKGLPASDENPNDVNSPKPAAAKGLLIEVGFGDESGWLELASDDALCGLEVRRHEPTQFETELGSPGVSAGLYVVRGTVRFTNSARKTTTAVGPGFVPITSDLVANMKASEIGRPSQLVLPDWLDPDAKRAAAKLKRPYNTPFEKEFDAEQPLLLSVPAIVNNPRPALSELAVKCLALTDSYQPLVKALIQGDHREARLAAITGLRQWLPTDPRNRPLLKAELARHVLPSDADAIYRLLWGFNMDDAKDAKKSRALVDWLDAEQVAIRELAFWHLQRLTGLKHEYSPINPPGQRRAAVERWNMHLDKKAGALIQE